MFFIYVFVSVSVGPLKIILAAGILLLSAGYTTQLPCVFLPNLVTCQLDQSSSIDTNFTNSLLKVRPTIKFLELHFYDGQTMLNDDNFAVLSGLVSLNIFWDRRLKVTQKAFAGLGNLTFLRITPRSNLLASPLFQSHWLKPLIYLKSLNVSRNGINSFEKGQFCILKYLKLLDLSYNHLKTYEDLGISCSSGHLKFNNSEPCLPSLTVLDISHNQILVLNEYFGRDLPRLHDLKADNSQLSSFTLESKVFIGLEMFDISYNKLRSFEVNNITTCNGSRLMLFKLKFNQLKHITPYFFDCTKLLWYLELSYNNLTVESLLQAGLSNLSNLLYLDLSGNNIQILQSLLFSKMYKLQRFHCEHCSIFTIESNTFSHVNVLEEVSLIGNPLQYFNISSRSFKNLQLSEIQLQVIPQLYNSTFLLTLNLSRNNITELGKRVLPTWKSLDTFILAFNNIRYIPVQVFKFLVSLTMLDLRNNNIHVINSHSFTALDGLRILMLDNNQIISINIDVQQFRNLQQLSISNNYIASFNKNTF